MTCEIVDSSRCGQLWIKYSTDSSLVVQALAVRNQSETSSTFEEYHMVGLVLTLKVPLCWGEVPISMHVLSYVDIDGKKRS